MCAADGSSQRPCILSARVDVVDKDLLEAVFAVSSVAAVFGVGHATFVPVAFIVGRPSVFKAITELLG